ncbi:MAG: hypothetical protein C0621_08985 [Desulfuromonas sp.]|nr:MAG: hypothetical protein C0621_08985 [Desulfuromonas sp.]
MTSEPTIAPLILVVDDQMVIRQLLQAALLKAGFQVNCVESGEKALDYCRDIYPDLVIMDAIMDGMDGFESSRKLREHPELKHLPILMMTMLDDSKSIMRAFDAGVTDFITKPVNLDLLIFRIRYMLKAAADFDSLNESRERLAVAHRLAKLGQWEWDPVSNNVRWSEEVGRILNGEAKSGEMTLSQFFASLHPDDRAHVQNEVTHLLSEESEKGLELNHRILRKDHSVRHVQTQAVREAGVVRELSKILGTMQDVTEQKLAEEYLRQSKDRFKSLFHEFETIFNGINDALIVWSPAGQVIWANESSRAFCPLQEGETLIGKQWQDIEKMSLIETHEDPIRRCHKEGVARQLRLKTESGRIWEVRTYPLRDPEGKATRVLQLATDLTEQIRLREEAARSAHLAALGEISAGIAHEINNPTGVLLLDLAIIQQAFVDAAPILDDHFDMQGDFPFSGLPYSEMKTEVAALLEESRESTLRIKKIVEELRNFSRPGDTGHFTRIDLKIVIEKALTLVRSQLRKSTDNLQVLTPKCPCFTKGNLLRLEQVLINLLLNASQALKNRRDAITIELTPGEKYHTLTVRDEGCGIDERLLSQVTDPFFTTRREEGGTGLGLSISSRIISEHQGRLNIESVVNQGTAISLTLPICNSVE